MIQHNTTDDNIANNFTKRSDIQIFDDRQTYIELYMVRCQRITESSTKLTDVADFHLSFNLLMLVSNAVMFGNNRKDVYLSVFCCAGCSYKIVNHKFDP